ncbi:MAG: deoxyribonuclease IV [Acidobacteria bacterium]|nr:deoxyribonuclease IV [Acidobacteriota bacterium]
MPRLGAHVSIAGGLPLAVERAALHRCEAFQIFSKSANQWRARPLPADEIVAFRRRVDETGIQPVVAHASYLINLAAGASPLRDRSIASFGEELDRAEALGLMGVVIHPGAFVTGSEDDGLRLIASAIAATLKTRRRGRTLVLLEGTAGQGTSLGYRFEHLADILTRVDGSPRVGVCLDTCHLLAAGFDICSEGGYRRTFRAFDRIVGIDRLKVFHLNDSKRPCQSRIDRHEHIGKGCIGLEPFSRLLNDRRFKSLPMLIETPKTEGRWGSRVQADPLDEMNLGILRSLMG